MRTRPALPSAGIAVVAATSVASALGGGSLSAVQAYELFHGRLGTGPVHAAAVSYSAPGMG